MAKVRTSTVSRPRGGARENKRNDADRALSLRETKRHAIRTAISRIKVSKLFGRYDYDLGPSPEACNPDRLLILYGDNGCGKTTILRTLFHILAPEGGEGHKTAVAGTSFGKFEVDFTSGDRVWAERGDGRTTGTLSMGLRLARQKEITIDFIANSEGAIKPTSDKSAKIPRFLSKLQDLNVGLYFLSDDRTVRLAGRDRRDLPFMRPELPERENEFLLYHDMPTRMALMRSAAEPEMRAQQLLHESIKRAEMWIQSQAVRAATEGESNVNTLYGEILKRISASPLDLKPAPQDTISTIEDRVSKLEARSKQYARYGLLPEFNGRDILPIVRNAPVSHRNVIASVATPYIESVEKKLDTMERLQRQVDTLVTIVNSFFKRKSITFEIHGGFKIATEDGKELAPQMLSSGERHLLLLFCSTLIALDRQSIFIIDEPEISLNIKWQRRLLASLLQCAGDNPVQYLFATHSFELLAQHKNNVIKVAEKSEGSNAREANY